ncbi:MAG: 6-bladed beta-propeller [Oscillibacter sp.]|nr:6-bladed beta-propeller [Oscillibacter sp.]
MEEISFVDDLAPLVDTMLYIVPDHFIPSPLCKMLIDEIGNMYMLGFRGDLITLTSEGKKYRHFISQGRARNEYIKINDIALREQPKELLVLDEFKVVSLGIEDTMSFKTFNTPDGIPCDALAPSGEKNVWLFSAFPKDSKDMDGQDDCLLRLVDEKGKVLEEMLKREDCTFSLMNITQSADNTYYLRPQNANQIFYQLGRDTLMPRYEIDFGNKNIPHRYFFDVVDGDITAYMRAPYFKQLSFAHETKNHFYFKCAGEDAIEYNFLVDKRNPNDGIGWINRNQHSDLYVVGADRTYFYIVFNKYQAEQYNKDKEVDLLYRYIMQSLDADLAFKNADEIIIKLAF